MTKTSLLKKNRDEVLYDWLKEWFESFLLTDFKGARVKGFYPEWSFELKLGKSNYPHLKKLDDTRILITVQAIERKKK